MEQQPIKALILAAGVGTRLRPLTDTCPKPMLPIAGRPLLGWTLRWLQKYGIREVALNLHHLPDVVQDGLGDGSRFDVRLWYHHEPVLHGTAGAVHGFPGFFDQPFLVVYGDLLLDLDLNDLIGFHHDRRALMTLALKATTTPHTQGMIELNGNGRVVRFIEKPTQWDSGTSGTTANAGVYICEPGVAAAIPQGTSDFGHDLIPALLRQGMPIYGRQVSGYLLDIGTSEAYARAQIDWARKELR
ncbi:MAG: nucleotidyltransferase family protein [Roseiflexaceae bacterium]|nr:nucleotidyltransferase family protein [Roseiflexaceae bacterium]